MREYNLPRTGEPEKSKNILKRILVEYYYLFCQQVSYYDHTGIKDTFGVCRLLMKLNLLMC